MPGRAAKKPVSQAQRRLVWWAKNNPKAAAKRGVGKAFASEMTKADTGGALPERKSRSTKWYDGK